ncbi:MAG: sensor histidine kinase [Planctomycetota bacterium]
MSALLITLSALLFLAITHILWFHVRTRKSDREQEAIEISGDLSHREYVDFREIMESAPDAMIIVNERGHMIWGNAQAERLFGYSRESILDKSVDILIPDRLKANHLDMVRGYFQNPTIRSMGEGQDLYARRRDGSEFPVEISLSPLSTDGPPLVASSIRDVTARKATEARLRELNSTLRQKQHEIEEYVYTVSHDLKSPAIVMKTLVDQLRRQLTSERYDKLGDTVDDVDATAQRMLKLIDDLLRLSRVSNVMYNFQPLSLTELVKGAVANHRAELENVGFRVDVQHDMPSVEGDFEHLNYVFSNLISNALKYGADADTPTLVINAVLRDTEVDIRFSDNGPGIPHEHHERIFKLFERLRSSKQGTGVGLSIVKRIVERHSGRVRVEPSTGRGTTLIITLPWGGPSIPQAESADSICEKTVV